MMAKITMNQTVTFFGNVQTDVRLAKEAGYDGIDLQDPKLYRYLDKGFSPESLLPFFEGIEVSDIGSIQNIEREGDAAEDLMNEVRRMSELASLFGAKYIQLCTGPGHWDVCNDFAAGRLKADDPRYRGFLGRDEKEMIDVTAANVRRAADIAAEYGVEIYVEPLAWTPLNRCSQILEVLEKANRSNVGLAVDTWQFYSAGDTPEDAAALPAELIKIVHVSDGLWLDPATTVADMGIYRNVILGGGVIPLQEWIDAIKSTGFDGWYCPEIFSDRASEQDLRMIARLMHDMVAVLIN
ncbi:sugar phosphate isomerase/epimerase [Bifidobacterium callitrichos]|uniref:Sugar phosphate isomerase/epimerase n=2 Tax=Bifidobacterium callitrichos TaxID=762209 RepID=A0A5M9ZB66_9BIFI|nr:sugar phosphate isomerase/epimerase [Bifidobacterium callitrichos]